MLCVLVMISYGQSWNLGFHKICYYDCGTKRFGAYDKFYRVTPETFCPYKLELT